jgi:peptidoglycan/xylan/chitin deacetylase (PgdA/CDA1 family)
MKFYLVLKKIAKLFLYYLWRERGKEANCLTVLTYHRISDEPDLQDPLKVSYATFEKQVRYLKKHYEIISGHQLIEIIKNNNPFPEKSCLITFDDGWKDNYTNAFKILKKHQVPAVMFICTDYVGTDKIFWHEELANTLMNIPDNSNINKIDTELKEWPESVIKKLKKVLRSSHKTRRSPINTLVEDLKIFDEETIRRFNLTLKKIFLAAVKIDQLPHLLSWNEAREMSQNNIYFGSHTKSHSLLTLIDEYKILDELKESKRIIETMLDYKVELLSYPNGNYNKKIISFAKEAGYIAAFSTLCGVNNSHSLKYFFCLKRIHINEHNSLGFSNNYSSLFFEIELSSVKFLSKIIALFPRD